VKRIESDKIVLENGTIPTNSKVLHIDCSATGIPSVATKPIFDGDRITIQWVRLCQPTFSAACIGFIETNFESDEDKNRLCGAMVPPTVPTDWLRMMVVQLLNNIEWSKEPAIGAWQAKCRLDPFAPRIVAFGGESPEAMAEFGRYRNYIPKAMAKLPKLLAR
jgi:hypothetical protein